MEEGREMISYKCANCGKRTTRERFPGAEQRFCSPECRNRYNRMRSYRRMVERKRRGKKPPGHSPANQ